MARKNKQAEWLSRSRKARSNNRTVNGVGYRLARISHERFAFAFGRWIAADWRGDRGPRGAAWSGSVLSGVGG